MVFQFYGGYRGGYGGGIFSDLVYWLEYWGVRDVILPFILIFTIFFALLQRIEMFGGDGKSKKYNVAIAISVALLTVIPHATGAYPPQYDIVNIINDAIPEIALLVIVVTMVLMMIGIGFGKAYGVNLTGWIALIAAILVVLFFVNALLPLPILQYIDPSIQALIIILLVFAIVIWFVTKEEPQQKKPFLKYLMETLEEPPSGGGAAGGGGRNP
jgi:hypothetical protein